jgi:uncharacterized cupin superfamily protein
MQEQVNAAVDVLSLELSPIGRKAGATRGEPLESGAVLYDDGTVSAGVWECTPGAFPSEKSGISEFMHFVAGEATITDEDGTEHEIRPGVAMMFPDGWRGTWDVRRTVRKTYTIVRSPQA